ncbi:DUF3800 domain-containing protein [Clostridium botulinum]|uniref:DUF3800 domain-containing protein n=1 Tax=Clostridium botulinum (strain Langeland / NCTC 10281 / Type F) TaxID=441772 RepID=A7GI53_CLOBL|nr:DUF3800 domain-containing protein [Clostridium botulinum]ABS42775.1 hypothetical protein CLI_3251 [Clostridium botulinum F str. Langeland]ADG00827.1 hypothetical protein CBF_3241 [Clostridium botulinum F str. 230613]KKM40666.1 hypothetical protein VT72_11295 [Clostridium botulinum]MBY6794358.1 DUF3800 domain-containing protein [Clostridium botulinum]MBY6938146.1 DUF3800 domain-containing protein [Clostridium botulinum]
MSYTLFIDESGNISKNNGERYFCIGGYLIEKGNKNHAYKMKKIVSNVQKNREKYFNINARKNNKNEVKFSNLNVDGKNYVYENFQKLKGTYVSIVVDKFNCTRLTNHKYNDYYNYLVYLLVKYVFDIRKYAKGYDFKELKIIYDNRSMKIEANNNLQVYLLKKLKIERKHNKFNCNFNIKEADSKVNYGVMISDFIAGLCWARYNYGIQKYGNSIEIDYLSKFPYKDFAKEIHCKEIEKKVLTHL